MSFPRYEKYKDSGVEWLGMVPSDWQVKPLKGIAKVVNGYPFDAKLFDPAAGFPLVRIRDLNQAAADTRYNGPFVEAASIDRNDVLIGMDGDFNVGRWLGSDVALLNQRMCCVRANTPTVTRYLEYVLPTPLKAINDVTYSTTVKHLSSFDVLKIRVAMPKSEDDVASIVGFLDHETAKIDALVEEQKRLIELLKEKRQAVISHAVTKGLNPNAPMKDSGVEWLGEVPAHWELCPLRRAFIAMDYGISDSLDGEGAIAVLRMGNIGGGKVSLQDLKYIDVIDPYLLLRAGDLLFNRTNSLDQIGKVGLFLGDGEAKISFASYLVRLRTSPDCVPEFFGFLLNCPGMLAEARANATVAIGQCNLNPTRYGAFMVATPPRDEQLSIAEFLMVTCGKLDELIREADTARTLLQERRTALISAAVTGKIDVRQTAAKHPDRHPTCQAEPH
jgi:type I restriction enzyme, S subunit